jgi:hypothetical protein
MNPRSAEDVKGGGSWRLHAKKIKNGARNQSKTKGYQINGEEYKHLQRIAKHFVKERLIADNQVYLAATLSSPTP